MKQKIIIAGGTGFIGQYLMKRFREAGYEVLLISRNSSRITWTDAHKIRTALEGAEALINLAGKSVDCRYTEVNKQIILGSRVQTTKQLQLAVDQCSTPPKLWINSSTATIYRHAEDRPMDETEGEIGTGFSVNVAKAWEQAFFEHPTPATRKVALRTAIVLGKGGGVMAPYTRLVKFGLGGSQGSGRQVFSWIHIEDVYQIIRFVMQQPSLEGVYNAAAPGPVFNQQFMQALRERIRPPVYFSSPEWLLQLGAQLIGTETELVLKSRWVIPKKLQEAGFQFRYPTVNEALDEIFGEK
ncbi:TIGR01777 family oxidoreductase [Niabella beijingensis]|uniref:TIGR01777 family oxidoreductase n=1 Tax=Niabella beijingensis TaxID=2872700 RepID=UPI001CBCE5A4|nr:TIGR01777 family oxidoreductase [Niabella beijingensis]MBZ4190302.1 TIGR01777 family oxidoreductase [Niabella beijingensis]